MTSRLQGVRKATRTQLKARVAFDGPTGAGKTYTAIEWATILQGDERTLVIDTEGGSAEWYSDRWDYDALPWNPPYDPTELAQTIRAAASKYAVVVVDSASHFWEGEGGTLDIVDAAAQRSQGNSFAGWKVGTPALRHLIDTILHADAHVLVTMRSKMDYVLEKDERTGRTMPRKVGMAPVMRSGVEYEFTLIGDLDLEHRLVISKSRCSALADRVVQPGRAADAARDFLAWLTAGTPAPPEPAPQPVQPAAEAAPGEGDNGSQPEALNAADIGKQAAKVFATDYEAADRGHKTKVVDRLRHAVVHAATKGRTHHASECSGDELARVASALADIAAGRITYKVLAPADDEGSVTFVMGSGRETVVPWIDFEEPDEAEQQELEASEEAG